MTRLIDLHEVNKTDACKVELLSFYEVELQKKLKKKTSATCFGENIIFRNIYVNVDWEKKETF